MEKGKYLYFGKTFLALHLHLFVFIVLALSPGKSIIAQGNLGLGTATPDSSAILHMQSTDKGVLVPSMSTGQRNSIKQPSKGLLIFNWVTNRFEYNAGTKAAPNWVAITSTDTSSSGLPEIIRDTVNYNVPPIRFDNNYKYLDIDVTVSGARIGATVFVSPASDLPEDVAIAYAYVKEYDIVRIRFININSSQMKNPDPMDYYITIIR